MIVLGAFNGINIRIIELQIMWLFLLYKQRDSLWRHIVRQNSERLDEIVNAPVDI